MPKINLLLFGWSVRILKERILNGSPPIIKLSLCNRVWPEPWGAVTSKLAWLHLALEPIFSSFSSWSLSQLYLVHLWRSCKLIQGPTGAFGGLVPCSKVPWMCSRSIGQCQDKSAPRLKSRTLTTADAVNAFSFLTLTFLLTKLS